MSDALIWQVPFGKLTAPIVASTTVQGMICGHAEIVVGWFNTISVRCVFLMLPKRLVALLCRIMWNPLPFQANKNLTACAPSSKTKIASSKTKDERRKRERDHISRNVCSNCHRPPILCVCDALPPQKIETTTHVLVLQHPSEFKRKSLSTVPLLPLVLQNCTVEVGYNFKIDSIDVVRECLARGRKPLLLFPGSDAVTLDDNNNNDDDGGKNNHNEIIQSIKKSTGELLILIDGTWAEARRILVQSIELVNACQQIEFSLEYESIYDVIRKEPEKYCISTLEACAESLSILEQDDDIALTTRNALHGVMKHMVLGLMQARELYEPQQQPK